MSCQNSLPLQLFMHCSLDTLQLLYFHSLILLQNINRSRCMNLWHHSKGQNIYALLYCIVNSQGHAFFFSPICPITVYLNVLHSYQKSIIYMKKDQYCLSLPITHTSKANLYFICQLLSDFLHVLAYLHVCLNTDTWVWFLIQKLLQYSSN